MDSMKSIAISHKEDILKVLFENKDEKYRDFTSSLNPSVNKGDIIGVRVPVIRALSKAIKGSNAADEFLNTLPHRYLEENHLHGFLIEHERDFSKSLTQITRFLPYIDNWATCDMLTPKCFKKYLTAQKCLEWMNSAHPYTVRFGIEMLMKFFLDEKFSPEYLDLVASVKSEHYYVKMMIAWYFATALSKQYESTIPIFNDKLLPVWEHNKAIQKAVESLRITKDQKELLKNLKIK